MELIVRHRDREEKVHLERTAAGYRVAVGEATYDVDVARAGATVHSLVIDGRQHEVTVRRQRVPSAPLRGDDGHYWVASAAGAGEVEIMDPLTHLARLTHDASDAGGVRQVTAYMPGRVVEILVQEGDEVAAGQGVVVLEAMKMKNEIQAESAGVVRKLLVEQDQTVEGGDPLFEIG